MYFVKPPARIGTPGSAGMLATARTPSTAGKPPIAERPPATASLKGTEETLATPGTPAIAVRPATVTHQELKGRAGHSLIFRGSLYAHHSIFSPVPEFIDPRFRENKPKTPVFSH
jgi:hypothetical protein